jgi:hypothetical protein
MTTPRTEQEVRKLKQEVRKIQNEVVFLHWNIATADRNIANSLKEFFKFAKLMRKISTCVIF